MNIVVTGSFGFDYIMDFGGRFGDRIMPDKIHCLSLSFLVDKLSKQYGGTAGNIAYTLNLLGITPLVLAPAGNDFVPYREFWEANKIPMKYVAIHKNVSTSAYFVMTDRDDNQIGSFFTGAMMYAKKLHIPSVKDPYAFVMLAPTEPKAMKQYVRECTRLGKEYMYDPAFQIGNFTASDLRDGITHAKILIGNDYEIALIEQKLGISHEELILMVPILITTLGPKGSIIETRHDAIHVKRANAENVCDPTGAGDAYRAGFLAGYLRGFPLDVCGQMGATAAVYTVEKYGTQTHTFTPKQFIARYKENFGKRIVL
jgi:adenosine kinase